MTLSLAGIIGFLTVTIAILVKVIGLPDQARKNYLRKSTEGISTIFFVLALISYLLWTVHGIIEKDTVLIIGQGVGIITTGIIVFQIIKYRNGGKRG
ncbi:MAG: SemiSWEET family transporter [Candidatus Nealsonbacteria bacterium]